MQIIQYYIETILSRYTKKNDFKINLLDLSYAEFNNELITKINNLEERIKYNEIIYFMHLQ